MRRTRTYIHDYLHTCVACQGSDTVVRTHILYGYIRYKRAENPAKKWSGDKWVRASINEDEDDEEDEVFPLPRRAAEVRINACDMKEWRRKKKVFRLSRSRGDSDVIYKEKGSEKLRRKIEDEAPFKINKEDTTKIEQIPQQVVTQI